MAVGVFSTNNTIVGSFFVGYELSGVGLVSSCGNSLILKISSKIQYDLLPQLGAHNLFDLSLKFIYIFEFCTFCQP